MSKQDSPRFVFTYNGIDKSGVAGKRQATPLAIAIRRAMLVYCSVALTTLAGCNGGSANNDTQAGDGDNTKPLVLRGINLGAVSDVVLSVIAVDADMDGDLDVMALSNDEAWIYENVSLDENPEFSAPTLYAEFSRSSDYRVLVDLDSDGDLDAVANAGAEYSDPIQIWYEENVGSNDNPVYQSNDQIFTYYNCTGTATGKDYWIGTDGSPENYVALVDIDADGDLDLFIGEKGGDMDSPHFGYCENTGDASSPQFAEAVTPEPFGLIPNTGTNFITFADMDNDGDNDAWVNHDWSGLTSNSLDFVVYENSGTTLIPSFTRVGAVTDWTHAPPSQVYGFPIQGCNHPHFADFNGDGLLDSLCPNGMDVSLLMGADDQ